MVAVADVTSTPQPTAVTVMVLPPEQSPSMGLACAAGWVKSRVKEKDTPPDTMVQALLSATPSALGRTTTLTCRPDSTLDTNCATLSPMVTTQSETVVLQNVETMLRSDRVTVVPACPALSTRIWEGSAATKRGRVSASTGRSKVTRSDPALMSNVRRIPTSMSSVGSWSTAIGKLREPLEHWREVQDDWWRMFQVSTVRLMLETFCETPPTIWGTVVASPARVLRCIVTVKEAAVRAVSRY
mmetsp:Transcript_27899/g.64812  ORF Transcript_27899/g.64812 Transcript_27899/m.64812 type:complete len:242 (+) Transcript_27899:647-1372(+)